MKIAWVSPFSFRSAIGRITASVLAELAQRGHQVRLIRSELDRSDEPSFSGPYPVSWWHDVSAQELDAGSDAVLVNIGDNYGFHAGAFRCLDAIPCVGIFHDYYLYNLLNRWVVQNGLGEDIHEREIFHTYGDPAVPTGRRAWQGSAHLEEISQTLPMTEWIGARCGAALAHSRFYFHRLEQSCPGPVAVAPLCFEGRGVEPLPVRSNHEVVITTIGVLNPNKCADLMIEALGSSPELRKRVQYRLVGAVTEQEKGRLLRIARDANFSNLEFLGQVDDAALLQELERASIISCLRKPVLEGASASAIEGMKSGRPIVVADAGFYADLPDDMVFKVPASVEVSALRAVLERLVIDEELCRTVGARARDWADRTFTTAAYVDKLEALLNEFIAAKPLLGLCKRFGRELAGLGVSADEPAVARIASTMHNLFIGNPAPPGQDESNDLHDIRNSLSTIR